MAMARMELKKGEFWSMQNDSTICFTTEKGLVWITQERDSRDIILEKDRNFFTSCRGLIVLQALADSEVRLTYRAKDSQDTGVEIPDAHHPDDAMPLAG